MNKSLSFLLLLCVIFAACKKNNSPLSADEKLVNEAKAFFYGSANLLDLKTNSGRINPRKSSDKIPVWEKATVVESSQGKGVIVPLRYRKGFLIKSNTTNSLYDINDVVKLLIYKGIDGKYKIEQITYLPEEGANAKYKGLVLVENGKTIKELIYTGDGKLRSLNAENDTRTDFSTAPFGNVESFASNRVYSSTVTICYYTEGYNYSADNPDERYYWREFLGCYTYALVQNVNDLGGGGWDYGGLSGGGGGSPSPAKSIIIKPGDNVIGNVNDYNKCFTNAPGSDYSYKVKVCVMQPNPGTRDPWGLGNANGSSATGNPFYVGHAYMVLQQTTPGGIITRNIGFYPSTSVSPYSPSSTGQYNNDEQRDFDISLTISMTNSQFFALLNYISQMNGSTYDLNSFNCTTYILNGLAQAGINLPRTTGTWVNGSGFNPGDFGEDIRNMQLPSNMTRSTSPGAHPNTGNCY